MLFHCEGCGALFEVPVAEGPVCGSRHVRCAQCATLHRVTADGVERVILRRPETQSFAIEPAPPPPALASSLFPSAMDVPDPTLEEMAPLPGLSPRRWKRNALMATSVALALVSVAAFSGHRAGEPHAAASEGAPEVPAKRVEPAPEAPALIPASLGAQPTSADLEPAPAAPRPARRDSQPAHTDSQLARGDSAAVLSGTSPEPSAAPTGAPAAPSLDADEAPVSQLPAMDEGALRSSMSAAAAALALCADPEGPHGSGQIVVTIAPSGRATRAVVSGAPFAGTAVGSCVARAFHGVAVPPFSGGFVDVRRPFHVP